MVSCCYSLIPSPSLHFPSLAVWKSRKKFLTITLHAMWCHVMQCKPTGVYIHSWLSFCDRHKLNVISLSILIVRSWNQPFVKDWAHACCEIHKKWWVYTAGLLGPASRNDQWYWMQQCNQNICKLILIIYPEVTCVASPHLKCHTSELLLTAGHIRAA